MKTNKFLKPLILSLPVALGVYAMAGPSSAAGVCDAPNNHPFKVTVSVTNDNGNPVVAFTNYDLNFGEDGRPVPRPFIYICLEGEAAFNTSQNNITWDYNPGDFTVSNIPNNSPETQLIIHNANRNAGVYKYSLTVQTQSFGEMLIDPRVLNGGGGTVE